MVVAEPSEGADNSTLTVCVDKVPSRRVGAGAVASAVLVVVLAGCGSDPAVGSGDSAAQKAAEAQASSGVVCPNEVEAIELPATAEGVPLPEGAVAFDVEEREGTGTIISAVSPDDPQGVLDELNTLYNVGGFSITTEGAGDRGTEASWKSADASGGWTVQDLAAACPSGAATALTVTVFDAG